MQDEASPFLSDEERDVTLARLDELSDADLVAVNMAGLNVLRAHIPHDLRGVGDRQLLALQVLLERFALPAFAKALNDLYGEERPTLRLIDGKEPAR